MSNMTIYKLLYSTRYIYFKKMEVLLIIKIIIGLGVFVGLYAILRNLDIIKIILIYFKDKLLGK